MSEAGYRCVCLNARSIINKKNELNIMVQNAIKEVSKGECIIMGDFNHGHIQWKSLESTGGDDQQF